MSVFEERLTTWQTQRRRCRDVYPGGCNFYVGPPNWDHRINRHKEPKHPTPEMSLAACAEPDTPAEVLTVLGNWENVDVSSAARAHPNYPVS